jgi:hypothetical protein
LGLPGPQIRPRSPNVPAGTAAVVDLAALDGAGPALGPDDRPQLAITMTVQTVIITAAGRVRLRRRRGIRDFYAFRVLGGSSTFGYPTPRSCAQA